MADPVTPPDSPTPAPYVPPVRNWDNAGEDYQPGDLGLEGLETIDNTLLSQVIADAGQAVQDKKNAKAIIETVVQSIKVGLNLFRPGLLP